MARGDDFLGTDGKFLGTDGHGFFKDTAGCAMGKAIFAKGYTESIDTAR